MRPLPRPITSSLLGLMLALVPVSGALAQSSDEVSNDVAWAIPAVAGLVAAAVAVIAISLHRRRQTTSIEDRLPEAPPEPNVRTPLESNPAAVGSVKEASEDVLNLLDNPAVAPPPGGAADLTADPWS